VAGAIVVIALVAAVGIALAVFGGPLVLAIVPLVIGAAVLAGLEVYRRRETAQSMSQFRREADSEGTEFTARDRETQA
jgi:membrane protein implicated in regulation of membrane protease activity